MRINLWAFLAICYAVGFVAALGVLSALYVAGA